MRTRCLCAAPGEGKTLTANGKDFDSGYTNLEAYLSGLYPVTW